MARMERVQLKRRLTAVLLADVVGYSRLMSVDEEGTHTRLGDCIKHLIEPTVCAYQGRLTRSKGDGLLVEFDSAVDAVRCAVDIQHRLADAATDSAPKLELRIGINSGDVIVDEHDVYGNSVNIASRIEGLAEPGGIYVTGAVREQLLGQPGLCLQELGERRVKNIDRPIQVYRVIGEQGENIRNSSSPGVVGRLFARRALHFGHRATIMSVGVVAVMATIGTAGLSMWPARPQLSPRASIMVLPFRNSSGDPGEDYIADAVTDDLTTDLSRLSDTLVIAQATAFNYKGKAVDVRDVGREFGVHYILEGSIAKVGTRVQANTQLIDTSSAAAIWADRFNTDVTTLLELYDAVTGRIAASLHLQLVRAEYRRAVAERATDPDATDLRLRAMAYLTENETPETSLAARTSLEASLARDPQNAESLSQLALVLVREVLHHWNHTTRKDLDRAEEILKKAFAIDRSIAAAHVADGFIRRLKGDEQGALDAFDRALELNPNLALASAEKGVQLIALGRAKEAPALVEKAIAISPRDPALWLFYHMMGRAYFAMGDYDKAINWLQKSVQLQPTFWASRMHLISAYALKGRLAEREVQAALSEYRDKFKNWSLPNIQEWFAKGHPNPHPGFAAYLEELYKGLQMAGV
jgi:class 3 adenylate cyclase/TolB-like protein/Flp pilus assembly protein TadD